MNDEHEKEIEEPGQAREFQEGVDYYFENGLMVLTAQVLTQARLLLRQRLPSLSLYEQNKNYGERTGMITGGL